MRRGLFFCLGAVWALGCSTSSSSDDALSAPDGESGDASAFDASTTDASDAVGDAAVADGNVADAAVAFDDAGALDGGVTLVCTSGVYWTEGNMGDPEMNPGGDCLGCHKSNVQAPVFTLAGTVYPTLHELTTCDGTARARVVVVDTHDRTFTLETNDAGNFACGETAVDGFPLCAGLAFPVSVRVEIGDASGPTITGQAAGNCNACHSPKGANGAPGRITNGT